MKEKNCFIDIHMLHTLAPTEIPVENSSSLQTIDFGKSRRASVSSESLTRGLNREFNESYIYDESLVDKLLFGKSDNENPNSENETAVMIADSYSTHAVEMEVVDYVDYDDVTGPLITGKANFFGFNTMYEYASIDFLSLKKMAGDDSVDLAIAFIDTLIKATAAGIGLPNTLPGFVYVTIRNDKPVSFVKAFDVPVTVAEGEQKSTLQKSINRLSDFVNESYQSSVEKPLMETIMCIPGEVTTRCEKKSLLEIECELEKFLKIFSQKINSLC